MIKQKEHFFQQILSELKRKRLFATFVFLVAVVGFINAFRFGGASVDYYSVRNTIEAWQNNAHIQTKDEYEEAKSAIANANMLHHSNPFYMNLTGQIKEWGFVSGFDEKARLQDAKFNYLEVTKLSPLWPVTWTNLAMVKWRLQEFDQEMLAYLSKANELGPYSVDVHILFTRLGISFHDAKHPIYADIEDSVHERIGLGLRNSDSRTFILAFIESTDSLIDVCRWMKGKDDHTASQHLNCP